jgi:aminopeptidase C
MLRLCLNISKSLDFLSNDKQREYHSYNNLTGTGFYEQFIWEDAKGLVTYKSGFGAEKNDIELQLISTN